MLSKQRRPLDDPPSAGSSSEEVEDSEEEEEMSEGEEKEQVQQSPNPNLKPVESEEEDDESEGEKEQVREQKTETSSNKKKNPEPESSSEPGDSDSLKSPRASDFTIKPIAPMSKPDTPMSKPAKRRLDSIVENGKGSKPKKAKPSLVDETAEKKSAINRLWSEEDEIAILKGLIEFQSNLGKDPSANQGEFHEFMKKSLHVDVSKNQLMDKVRRLKKKYKNNLEKSTHGEDPVLSKAHEYKSFKLSKNIWGNLSDKNPNANVVDHNPANNGGNHEKEKSSGRSAKKNRVSDKLVPAVVPVETATDTNDLVKVKVRGEKVVPSQGNEENVAKLYPFLFNAFPSDSMSNALSGLNVVKRNLNLIGMSELNELDSEWKELSMAETELKLRKLDLIREQTRMVLDAMKSSKP